jgi:hypothetical protein
MVMPMHLTQNSQAEIKLYGMKMYPDSTEIESNRKCNMAPTWNHWRWQNGRLPTCAPRLEQRSP